MKVINNMYVQNYFVALGFRMNSELGNQGQLDLLSIPFWFSRLQNVSQQAQLFLAPVIFWDMHLVMRGKLLIMLTKSLLFFASVSSWMALKQYFPVICYLNFLSSTWIVIFVSASCLLFNCIFVLY